MNLRELYSSDEPEHRILMQLFGIPFVGLIAAIGHWIFEIDPRAVVFSCSGVLLFNVGVQLFRWRLRRYDGIDEMVIEREREAARNPPARCGQCGIDLLPGMDRCHWCGWEAHMLQAHARRT